MRLIKVSTVVVNMVKLCRKCKKKIGRDRVRERERERESGGGGGEGGREKERNVNLKENLGLTMING